MPGRLYPGQLRPAGYFLATAGPDPLLTSPAGAGDDAGPGDGPGEGHGPAGAAQPGPADAPPPAVPGEEALSPETRPAADVNV